MITKVMRVVVGGTIAVLTGWATPREVVPKEVRTKGRFVFKFPAEGVTSVVVRAAEAEQARVIEVPDSKAITVSAVPAGGAVGYHSPDPGWKETTASDWGLEFVGRQYGQRLVISSRNEIGFMHHNYRLKNIEVRAPVSVRVLLKARELDGDGEPDLER